MGTKVPDTDVGAAPECLLWPTAQQGNLAADTDVRHNLRALGAQALVVTCGVGELEDTLAADHPHGQLHLHLHLPVTIVHVVQVVGRASQLQVVGDEAVPGGHRGHVVVRANGPGEDSLVVGH